MLDNTALKNLSLGDSLGNFDLSIRYADFAGPIAENELTNGFCVDLMRRIFTAQIQCLRNG